MLSLIKIITEIFVWYKKRSYLCTVFFMVLDLRLTEEGRREMAFFSFFTPFVLDVTPDLDAHFETEIVVFGILEAHEESDVKIVVVYAIA